MVSGALQPTIILLFCLLTAPALNEQILVQSCIEYSDGACIRCDLQTHLYQNFCYRNILGCIRYDRGSKCAQCEESIFNLIDNRCDLKAGLTLTTEIANTLYRYTGSSVGDPSANFGQAGFMPSSYEAVAEWPTFKALNNFILRGEYSHFISRVSNPVYAVHYYLRNQTYSYKLLYFGSGGGLFLCIADVPPTLAVQLRSLTPISASMVIDFCNDYDTDGRCLRCMSQYHLENGRCFANYGGCSRYRENICIECLDFYFLVENRCISDCVSVSDARSMLSFEGRRNSSTLEFYYSASISNFYSSGAFTTTVLPTINISSSQTTQTTQTSTTTQTTIITSNISSTIGSSSTFLDPNCASFDSAGNCQRCSSNFFRNRNNICQQVNPLCASFNQTNGACLTCFMGYRLANGDCLIAQ